jgi:pimeloyl-ACP methyl ester carboxylesterase
MTTQDHPVRSLATRALSGWTHGVAQVDESVRLHYVVEGAGEPVVLLPGWPQSWYAWRHLVPLLVAEGRQVVAVDPRGFGDSDLPPDGYSLSQGAHDLHVFLQQLGLDRPGGVDIVSHDVGSWIAHAHATAYPADVRRLVLSDAYIPGVSPPPPGAWPDQSTVHRQWHFFFNRVEGLPEALIQGKERELLTWFFGPAKLVRTWTIDPAAFEEYLRVFRRPGAVRAGLSYYRDAFSPQGLAAGARRSRERLMMPVLTLGGEHADADNLFETVRENATELSHAVFAGVGHHLPEECPEEMAEEIRTFWRRWPR